MRGAGRVNIRKQNKDSLGKSSRGNRGSGIGRLTIDFRTLFQNSFGKSSRGKRAVAGGLLKISGSKIRTSRANRRGASERRRAAG